MSRIWWIVILVAAGVGLAVVIGVLGTRNEPSKTDAVTNLCDSLGEIAQLSGSLALARQYYQQGLAAVESERSMLSDEKYKSFLSGFHKRIDSLDKKP